MLEVLKELAEDLRDPEIRKGGVAVIIALLLKNRLEKGGDKE